MLLGLCFIFLLTSEIEATKKIGDSCVVQYTNTQGVCEESSKCTSANEDFYNNGIRPTFCLHTLDTILVCCKDDSSILNTAPPPRKSLKSRFVENENENKRVSERKCEEYSSSVTETFQAIPLIPDPRAVSSTAAKCDYEGVELIIGGEKANRGEFPHMAAIGWLDVEDNYVFGCGGSLISPRFVLSAGHCIKTPRMKVPEPVIVRLGDQNLDPRVNDGASPVDVPIKKIHKHPLYKSPVKYHDIALFELNSAVEDEPHIRPACLWTRPDFGGFTKAVATGWGVTSLKRNAKPSNELQKVSLTLLENDFCDPLLENVHNNKWWGFKESQMCAGELRERKDTCQGDSGSPLQVASDQNRCIFHIVGITSFGRRCAEQGRPAVYTRVSHYLDWIESVVWPEE